MLLLFFLSIISIFAWRLLHNPLPTTNSLIKRMVLQPNTNFCVDDYGHEGDINHLILFRDFFDKIWFGIYNWLGLITVHSAQVSENLLQFGSIGVFLKNVNDVFNLI